VSDAKYFQKFPFPSLAFPNHFPYNKINVELLPDAGWTILEKFQNDAAKTKSCFQTEGDLKLWQTKL